MSEETQRADLVANALATMSAVIAPVQEATVGYRRQLIEMGMGAESADRCAADYHGWLLSILPGRSGAKR